MAYSQELVSRLRDILDGAGYHTTFEAQGDTGIFSMRMKLRCRLQSVSMLIIVREDNFSTLTTLPLTVHNFKGRYYSEWNLIFADLIIVALPMVLLYITCQKYVVSGVTAGAVKG